MFKSLSITNDMPTFFLKPKTPTIHILLLTKQYNTFEAPKSGKTKDQSKCAFNDKNQHGCFFNSRLCLCIPKSFFQNEHCCEEWCKSPKMQKNDKNPNYKNWTLQHLNIFFPSFFHYTKLSYLSTWRDCHHIASFQMMHNVTMFKHWLLTLKRNVICY